MDRGRPRVLLYPCPPPVARDLLARLPAHRLEDVVWIDCDRKQLAKSRDVPRLTRVGIDPFETPPLEGTDLQTDPVPARVSDCPDVFSTHSRYFDWNVGTVWATLLPWLFDDPDEFLREEMGIDPDDRDEHDEPPESMQ